MEKPLSLSILYTANIRGNLQVLPRLYTAIQKLQKEAKSRPLLLDLGMSCIPEVWHCGITGGRSTLIVMDAMGYHAANIAGMLDMNARQKLRDVVGIGLVDEEHPWHYDVPPIQDESIIFEHPLPSHSDPRLQILASPQLETKLDGNVLSLREIEGEEIGIVEMDLTNGVEIVRNQIVVLAPGTRPNPTIVASVEFVESEARYFEKKQQKS